MSAARTVPESRAAKQLSSAKSLASPAPGHAWAQQGKAPSVGTAAGGSTERGWSTVLKQWFLLLGVRERLVKTMDSQKNAPNAADASRGFTGSGKAQSRTVCNSCP